MNTNLISSGMFIEKIEVTTISMRKQLSRLVTHPSVCSNQANCFTVNFASFAAGIDDYVISYAQSIIQCS